RTLTGDLHRLGGIWSIWFLAIVVVTGLWYFWIRVGEPMLGFPRAVHEFDPPEIAAEVLDRMGPQAPGTFKLDVLAANVRRALPDSEIRHVKLPEVHGAAITFGGNTGEFFGPGLSEVYVDPYGGANIGRRLSRDGFSFGFVRVVADALHFGDFAGLASKL